MQQTNRPLSIPSDFDTEAFMPSTTTENGRFHPTRSAAGFAQSLVVNGAPEDLELAEKVLDALLMCQERREGDAHHGNFWWMKEDGFVEDLNAVEFVLERLIPMMAEYGDRLSPQMQKRLREAIRLGLAEIARLDVLVAYTNIAALDILNTCLGGELLGDESIAERGYQKMVAWMAFTDAQGIPFEYNSPTYTQVTIGAFNKLANSVQHHATQVRARTVLARLGLSVALHIHQETGRWTGPHSRAYQPTVTAQTDAEVNQVRRWIAEGTLPGWIDAALTQRPTQFQVTETAYVPRNAGITTYHSPSFALGTSVTEMGGQSNVLMVHYQRPGSERPGVLYSRYLLNDKWLGDFYHATDRTTSRNLLEEGHFYGVQQGPRAIGLYTPSSLRSVSSAKAALIWTGSELVDEIWVGENRVSSLPVDVPPGEIVVVGSGEALIGVLPLTHTDLGHQAPVRLREVQGDLVLEIHNYLGPRKVFWEMEWPGGFYKGKPQCGVYLEVAERGTYPDGKAFAKTIRRGVLTDAAAAPFVYADEGERLWKVAYSRDGETLGLEVDLMQWKLKRRWNQEGDLGWPMLECPTARESKGGKVTVGDATFLCGREAGWLFASPATHQWVAAYHGHQPAPAKLVVPDGQVEIEAMGTGVIVWDNGEVIIDALDVQGEPEIKLRNSQGK